MRIVVQLLAILAIVVGLLWIGQGLGLVHWPASSFMIDERPWALRGALLAAVGIAILVLARRRTA